MAHALGIDLSNPSDPIVEMVNVGIADFDPTRVLRNCEHMFLTLGRQGHGMFHMVLAQQLQLPTMAQGRPLLTTQVHAERNVAR